MEKRNTEIGKDKREQEIRELNVELCFYLYHESSITFNVNQFVVVFHKHVVCVCVCVWGFVCVSCVCVVYVCWLVEALREKMEDDKAENKRGLKSRDRLW